MSPASEVCVDASLVIKVVVTESDSDKADALFDQWANEGKQLIAPLFFEVETDSILRQKVALRKELTAEQAGAAFARLRGLPIQRVSEPGQRERAWEIATGFGFATVYDRATENVSISSPLSSRSLVNEAGHEDDIRDQRRALPAAQAQSDQRRCNDSSGGGKRAPVLPRQTNAAQSHELNWKTERGRILPGGRDALF
jgi:predicted nucleic acid-binding protein